MTAATLNQSPVIVQTFMGAIYSNVYYAADTGSANAAVIPLSASPASYLAAVGTKWSTIAKATNTSSSMTAKIGSLAAVPVLIDDGVTPPAPGQYIAGQYYELTPNAAGTGLILLNPSAATGTTTLGSTGISGGPTCTLTWRLSADGCFSQLIFGTGIAGNGSSAGFTLTGLPTWLAPAVTQSFYTTAEDATAATVASLTMSAASTVITLNKGASIGSGASGWTASGTRAFSNGPVPGQNISIGYAVR